jgi:hypothetical protein
MPQVVDYWLAGVEPAEISQRRRGHHAVVAAEYICLNLELANRIAVLDLPLYGGDPPCKPVPKLTKRRAK